MWKNIDTVVYYIDPKFKFNSCVAIFSLLNTIIKDQDDGYLYDTVKSKLIEIDSKGASIIILQSCTVDKLDSFKEKINKILEDLKIPMVVFFTTKFNKYAKPFTNIWKIIEILYKKEKKTINKDISVYIGNNACRVVSEKKSFGHIVLKKIDVSGVDRAFAKNIGLTFYTPEIFFQNNTEQITWNYGDHMINMKQKKNQASVKKYQHIIIDEINSLPISDKYIIIVTGAPFCGKSTLAQKIKRKWDADCN